MLCVFKGLRCVIVKLIVKLSLLGQSQAITISSKIRTNSGRMVMAIAGRLKIIIQSIIIQSIIIL